MNPIVEKDLIKIDYGAISKRYKIIPNPVPHIIVNSKKQVHGWWNSAEDQGKRACTSERLLINPYNGCSWNCFFCYAHALWGYYKLFREKKIIAIFKDFDKEINSQLKNLLCASCGYISPTTDPFQPVNNRYRLTEKIMRVFLKYDLPVEISSKGVISEEAIKIMAEHKYNHCFGQISFLTLNDNLRKNLVLGKGANTNQLIRNIKKLANSNIHAVCRIDPIIPYVTDNISDIKEIINTAVEAGANHIGTSILDIPLFIKDQILRNLTKIKGKDIIEKYNALYTERITSDLHANISYRKDILREIKKYCLKIGVTMSTCMEFEVIKKNGQIFYNSLNNNHQFMTSDNCEGINVPIYTRKSINENFKPVKCKGDCLYCKLEPVKCKIPPLKKGKNWDLKNYREWSKGLKQNQFNKLSNFI